MSQDDFQPPAGKASAEYRVPVSGGAEMRIRCFLTEQLLQSREVEEQTRIPYLDRSVLLWEALRSVAETCFSLWSQAERQPPASFVGETLGIKERCAQEGQDLVLLALKNPLQSKAIARAMLLGHNFLRTLDICYEAMLGYPSQKSLTRKPREIDVVIDWAVGGIRDWAVHYPYAFEPGTQANPGQRLAHVTSHYSTDRVVRSQISHKQIANIFMLQETTVADLERRALGKLREAFKAGEAAAARPPRAASSAKAF
ncbi:MAG TPA: hypothetical protein VHV47_07380 [Opitutaceae bacterium]|jgi:hypothetical protein|nr:hypothetical protein [Opitutaceae bacterium]